MKLPKVPNTLSREWCESLGWTVDHCDRWIPGTMVTKDLFGMFDLVALSKQGTGIIGIQATGERNNARKRMRKIAENEAAGEWIKNSGTIAVHSWQWRGQTGAKKLQLVIFSAEPCMGDISWYESDAIEFRVVKGKVQYAVS